MPVALAPGLVGLLGIVYLAVAVPLCAGFVWSALRLLRRCDDASARAVFRVSLLVLFGLFVGMLADLTVG